MFNPFNRTKKEPKDLKEILDYLKTLDKDIKKLAQNLEGFKKESENTFQKIGIVRFNPFEGIGGDQSFSIALLDAKNNGLVISSLYSKEGSRVFAKPVESGKSKYQLSEEEKKALEKAIAK